MRTSMKCIWKEAGVRTGMISGQISVPVRASVRIKNTAVYIKIDAEKDVLYYIYARA